MFRLLRFLPHLLLLMVMLVPVTVNAQEEPVPLKVSMLIPGRINDGGFMEGKSVV